jgi:UDP-sulfoquinovose synthase
MKVLIAGIDGYLGWSLAVHLCADGYQVAGLDAFWRRRWVEEVNSHSAIPIASIEERITTLEQHYGQRIVFHEGDMLDYAFLADCLADVQPDVIVHFAEMPSAPYSMIDHAHAAFTQQNNVIGSLNLLWAIKAVCPQAHLIKLGTMGEYGTPDIDIPEGFFEVEYRGRKDTLPFPRQASSFYHWSKVHDSNNTMFACRSWGLRSTDIMQGVVFGSSIPATRVSPALNTRLDFDQCFGTVLNRFCCQAVIGHPLTVYGVGKQTRGFLPLCDSIQCINLIIDNPPARGEYRVVNQFDQCYSVEQLALIVQQVGQRVGLDVSIEHVDNPRLEKERHHYNPDRNRLVALGYKPSGDIHAEVEVMLSELLPHRQRILERRELLIPDICWDGSRARSGIIAPTEDQIPT